ncbi:MAG: M1 family metallopeptidase [Salibacteraceae bacterium]
MLTISGCGLLSKSQDGSSPGRAIMLDTMEIDFEVSKSAPYQIAPSIEIDVLHIELDLAFDWAEQSVLGKAKLAIQGFGSPKDSIFLDARGFELHSVRLLLPDTVVRIAYDYDGLSIGMALPKPLTKNDTIMVAIDYTARPNDLEQASGSAITSDKGLYFINPSGEDAGPQQIWTQGEPEANSAWFPSVDHPHEKITHEIFVTVDTSFHTVSNGKLMYSELHANGKRTDYWKQDKPHANYLVMLAIGEFGLYKDNLNEMPVWYYLDEEYLPHAQAIFGNTPEMIQYYGELLNYPYPWDKYHQIVVKDFVSGAMENTSAVIHGDFVQLTERELLDESHEDVIAHELFHHWFGDLVTCESWTQLTMNEGFATYGEYLWIEHKYGLEEARLHLQADLEAYLGEVEYTPKHLIRHHYNTPDDVFDSHTYQKGGRVLHMLRLEVGDEVFFKALNHYLTNHEYGSVEAADLRQSMEQISGRDLAWFFDQWYKEVGHPQVQADFIDTNDSWMVVIRQTQREGWPTYRFHLPVSIGDNNGSLIEKVYWIDSKTDTIHIPHSMNTAWIALDPYGDMLWESTENKPIDLWVAQLKHAPSFISREDALINLWINDSLTALAKAPSLINDPFWLIRQYGIDLIVEQGAQNDQALASLTELSQLDPKSSVRASAFVALDSLAPSFKSIKPLFLNGIKDKSYFVVRTCLNILSSYDPCEAKSLLGDLVHDEHGGIPFLVSKLYAKCPEKANCDYYTTSIDKSADYELFVYANDATKFAIALDEESVFDQIGAALEKANDTNSSWWSRYSLIQFLYAADAFYSEEINRIESMPEASIDEMERLAQLRQKKAENTFELTKVEKAQATAKSPFTR